MKIRQNICRKVLSGLLVALLGIGAGGCGVGSNSNSQDGEQVTISIGGWPLESANVSYARYEEWLQRYNELYPDVTIEKDNWAYTYDTFLAKAASNMLPSVFTTFFTEINKIADAGYAADITEQVKKYGFAENLNDDLVELCEKDGKWFTAPKSTYALCLVANKEIFREAGLVDADGYPILPQTIDELTQTAITIKEKTGKIGFILPTMKKLGGWIFSNIAWQFGVEFIKQEGDRYVANFNSPEMKDALQWLYKMKWEYNVLGDNAFIDDAENVKLFGSGQGAMYVGQPTEGKIKSMLFNYGFEKDNLVLGQVPGGKGGRYALIGGDVWVLNSTLNERQKDAVFDWLTLTGYGSEVDADSKASIENHMKDVRDLGAIVGIKGLEIWKAGPVNQAYEEARNKYRNVDPENFREYDDFSKVELRSEEPVHCQDLYDVIDGILQEVLTKQNVDIDALLQTSADNFQRNFLDE